MASQKRVAIMQPYFLPYIGYWKLMDYVDTFVLYDNIQFGKKSWIHRNRYLLEGKGRFFTIPVKKDSDYLDVVQRQVSDRFALERVKIFRKFQVAYRAAPFYEEGYSLLESCFSLSVENLFDFIYQSILEVRRRLSIETELLVSSSIKIDHELKGQDRVVAICQSLEATDYVNPMGGRLLYSKDVFSEAGISLSFQQVNNITYPQFGRSFVPNLSIIDCVMFNGVDKSRSMLSEMACL